MHKFDIIYKFSLIALLFLGLALMCFSGVGLWLNLNLPFLLPAHLFSALLLISGLLLHIFNRKNKLVKIKTQFVDLLLRNKYPSYCNLDRLIMSVEHYSLTQICQTFQLEQSQFHRLLGEAHIQISNTHQPLRTLFPHNDEKIFAIITLALQQVFPPQKHIRSSQ